MRLRFFCQAEDGIRDLYVTGVQTCALPILALGVPKERGARMSRTTLSQKTLSGNTQGELWHDHNHDGIDRRGFLKCMAWAGTGAFCVIRGGVLHSYGMSRLAELDPKEMAGELSFAQISDSHMGFNKPANPDVAGTLKAAVDKINALSGARSEEHTSELQSRRDLVCRLLLEKKK